jgi:hypothetical protein
MSVVFYATMQRYEMQGNAILKRREIIPYTTRSRATISFVMSVCPSVHMEQLGSHWTDFDETWYFRFFKKSVKNIQISLKFDKNNG